MRSMELIKPFWGFSNDNSPRSCLEHFRLGLYIGLGFVSVSKNIIEK